MKFLFFIFITFIIFFIINLKKICIFLLFDGISIKYSYSSISALFNSFSIIFLSIFSETSFLFSNFHSMSFISSLLFANFFEFLLLVFHHHHHFLPHYCYWIFLNHSITFSNYQSLHNFLCLNLLLIQYIYY